MILELFALLVAISLVLVGFGYWLHVPLFGVIGFTLLFILSVFIVLPNSVQVQSGSVMNVSGNVSTTTFVYASYNDSTTHYFGYFLAVLSGVMFWLVMASPGYNHEAD